MSTIALEHSAEVRSLAEALRPGLLRVGRRLRQASARAGLSAQDALLLGQIKSAPGIGVCDLADAEQLSRPAMSSHIKRLVAAGWVERIDDAEDGRRAGLVVTAAGQRRLETIRRQRDDWLAARLARLNPAERERLRAAAEVLQRLASIEA